MAKMLLNFRGVPEEEIEDVRELMAEHGIEVYELPASAFLISAGSLWVRNDSDYSRARELFDEYQFSRAERARMSADRRGFVDQLRAEPGKVIGYIAVAVLILLFFATPIVQLMR